MIDSYWVVFANGNLVSLSKDKETAVNVDGDHLQMVTSLEQLEEALSHHRKAYQQQTAERILETLSVGTEFNEMVDKAANSIAQKAQELGLTKNNLDGYLDLIRDGGVECSEKAVGKVRSLFDKYVKQLNTEVQDKENQTQEE